MRQSGDSQQHVIATLREREMVVEHSINFVRIGVFSFGVVTDVISAVLQGLATASYVAFIVVVSVFVAAYLLVVHLFSRGRGYHGWLKYLTITVDSLLPVAFLLEMARPEFAGRIGAESVVAITALVIVIIIMVNALRLSAGAVVYSTLLGAGIVLASTLVHPMPPVIRVWLAPLVLVTGVITWWISRNVGAIIQALRRREKLARFLPREVVTMLEGTDLEVTLGGKTARVTVLFADIRGFTSFCENRSPDEIVEVLNEYFTLMSAAIREQGGMIDKYIGDAIMAVFGAPLAREDHAARAAAAAQAMLRELGGLNQRWATSGRRPFAIGIALHTGDALAGTIGAPDRMDYTVIGDTVNLTARLEELNKTYHTPIILSEETLREMGDEGRARFLGEVPIRGRGRAVKIYTLDGAGAPETVPPGTGAPPSTDGAR